LVGDKTLSVVASRITSLEGETMLSVKRVLGLAVAAVAGVACSSHAAPIDFGGYTGPITLKFSNFDVGSQYIVAPGTPANTVLASNETAADLLPHVPPLGANPDEDSWGIARVSTITKGTTGNGDTLYSRSSNSTEIDALFWGGDDVYVATGNGDSQFIHSNGLHIAFFLNPTGTFPADGAGNPTSSPATRINLDPNAPIFAGVTSGTPWLTMNSVAGFDPTFPTDQFFTQFSPSGALAGGLASQGGLFAELGAAGDYGTGSANNTLVGSVPGPDVRIQFTGVLDTTPTGWLIDSNDPAVATAIVPEPTSIALIGALSAIGASFRPSRRRAK
jgi:hypothetical protein